jgi:uncharacterized protein YkwD
MPAFETLPLFPFVVIKCYMTASKQWTRGSALLATASFCATLLLLSSPALGTPPVACDHVSPVFEGELLDRINQYRAGNGLGALSRHKTLDVMAKRHSRDMCKEEVLSHDGFSERFHQSGKRRCVENVGWNCTSAAEQFTMWKRSPGHNHNLLDEGIRSAGLSRTGPYVTFFACD